MKWRPELTVEEIGSPQRIAPRSVAFSAELKDNEESGNGRFILLHDPAGNDSWDGRFRCAAFVSARIDLEMAADPLLSDVGWSWLLEALNENCATFDRTAGTVTTVLSKSFGAISPDQDRADIEIRASWTPRIGAVGPIGPHLAAWQHLLCTVAGYEAFPEGVIPLRRAGHGR